MRSGIIAASLVPLLHPHAAAAQNEPIEGPKKICFMYSSLDLPAGQSVAGFRSSVESMQVEVRGLGAGYTIDESETFAEPSSRGTLVASYGKTRVYRAGSRGNWVYALYGPARFADGAESRVLILSGRALTGGKKDAEIYSRFRIVDPSQVKCAHGFRYGWDLMLPDGSN